jgi:hypothetical protein
MAYLLLEEHDDGNDTNADELVENAAQKLHFHHLGDDNPETDEDDETIEDVHGAGLLHEFVAGEEYHRHKEYVK